MVETFNFQIKITNSKTLLNTLPDLAQKIFILLNLDVINSIFFNHGHLLSKQCIRKIQFKKVLRVTES